MGDLYELERDAVAAALETWGGRRTRKRVLLSAGPKVHGAPAPFLARLPGAQLGEDIELAHDQNVFPAFDVVRRYKVGAVQFKSGATQLTVVNCNRQPLEHVLGVDLVYYNHHFKSFIMVQYKRMNRRSRSTGEYHYYSSSDRNFTVELRKMNGMDARLGALASGDAIDEADSRLSERPFYFKFCDARTTDPLSDSMVSGFYCPLRVVRIMRKVSRTLGRKSPAPGLDWTAVWGTIPPRR